MSKPNKAGLKCPSVRTCVCRSTRSKVKVTSPSKLEIRPFSKAISSAIYNGNWPLTTDSQTKIWLGRIFDIWSSFCVMWLWSWQKHHLRKVDHYRANFIGWFLPSIESCAVLHCLWCRNVQYIERDGTEFFHTLRVFPEALHKKMTLLKYFRNYMSEHLLKVAFKHVTCLLEICRYTSIVKERLSIFVTERWARSWSRCTVSLQVTISYPPGFPCSLLIVRPGASTRL